jgi:hypothetical protein
MKPIGYAEHLTVYFIQYSIDDFIYFRFCKGKLKKAKIQYDENGDAFFMIENTLRYFLKEVIRA